MPDSRKVLLFSASSSDFDLLDEKRKIALPVDELRNNLEDFIVSLQDILAAADKPAGKMGLKSASVAVGINAKGQVGFLGTGVEVGGSATLTLTFERA
jgi:preprotein translocase subunit Sss1